MIGEIDHAGIRTTLGTVCLAPAGVKANAANVATTTAVTAVNKGLFVNVPVAATISTAKVFNSAAMQFYAMMNPGKVDPGKVAAPVNPGCSRIYVVAADKAGACAVFEGDNVTADTNSNQTPAVHPDMTAIGVFKVKVDVGSGAVPFRLGTTALATNAGTKLTVTFADVFTPWSHY